AEILTPVGLTEGTGYVGASTRRKLNILAGGETLSSSAAPLLSLSPTSTSIQTFPAPGASVPSTTPSSQNISFSFTKALSQGSADEEVKNLQILLNKLGFQVAQSGIGSSGNETDYFGNLTKQAVIKFQNYYRAEILTPVGLTEGTGYVGASTRRKLNALSGEKSLFFKTPVSQILSVIDNIDLISIRNALSKAVLSLQANDFKELIFNKGGKNVGISEFLPAIFGQSNPSLDKFFEENFASFVWINNNGGWPGYIFKLKSSISFNDVQNQLFQLEKTDKFDNIFIKLPGAIQQLFKDGKVNSAKTRYQLYSQPGAELNYGWKDNFLIISSSYGGFLEALARL
ncbi:MAG: peptidoglycan-binding protein, partial [Candidatus Brennerbacteria bacterium]|nr:peptidoglycan-binding protein [Candidatus Brennerbacteria bacterium]